MKKNIFKKISFRNLNFFEKIVLFFPFCALAGSLIINIYLIFVSIIFVYQLIKDKKLEIGNDLNWVIIYVIFILYCFTISFFASDIYNSIRASIGQIRFLLFSLFIIFFFKDIKKLNFLINVWFILVLVVVFDLLFQSIFLFNIIGIPISDILRPSSFFGDEVVAGAFIVYSFIPIMFFYMNKFIEKDIKKKIIYIFIYSTIFYAVVITGERLALIMFLGASLVNVIFFLRLYQIFSILY